ncbi:MAG: putative carbohydrate kinase [Methanoregulaceae archaeon PtaU1.Bin059]|nr:MAG: putative carbohydrate kinase [Methanoregulaceae archaeon PtaU1.Bin059]
MVGRECREFLEQGVISAARMRAVDGNAMALGVSSLQLMESAGKALADLVRSFRADPVLILCGKGNNGGDGMVAARHLQDLEVCVIYLEQGGRSPDCEHQLKALSSCPVDLVPVRCPEDVDALGTQLEDAGCIVDALLGTGSTGSPREPIRSLVEAAQSSSAVKVSADVPTPGFVPGHILAFHRPKVDGSLVADIGIPLEAEITVGPGDLTILQRKDPGAHKGAGGEVLIVGGGPYQGAPYLAGLGALRAGADIVRIASPVFEPVPDLIYERLEGKRIGPRHLDTLKALAERADVVVMGNGLGDRSHGVMVELARCCRRAVVDADAIKRPLPRAEDTIYTPHAGEFARMTGVLPPGEPVPRARAVRDAAQTGTILLKGKTDIISDGARVRFNRTGSPLMTVGGTGDVLAGVAAALFCHLPAFESACLAAYVNGRAGMAVEKAFGGGMLPTDLVDRIPLELFRRSEPT